MQHFSLEMNPIISVACLCCCSFWLQVNMRWPLSISKHKAASIRSSKRLMRHNADLSRDGEGVKDGISLCAESHWVHLPVLELAVVMWCATKRLWRACHRSHINKVTRSAWAHSACVVGRRAGTHFELSALVSHSQAQQASSHCSPHESGSDRPLSAGKAFGHAKWWPEPTGIR